MLTTPASRQDGVEVGDRMRTVCESRVRTGTARAPGCGPRGAISVVTIFLGLQEGRKLAGDPRLGSASRFALQASTWSTWAKDSAVGRTYLSRVRNPGAKRELTRSASHASRVSFQSGCHHYTHYHVQARKQGKLPFVPDDQQRDPPEAAAGRQRRRRRRRRGTAAAAAAASQLQRGGAARAAAAHRVHGPGRRRARSRAQPQLRRAGPGARLPPPLLFGRPRRRQGLPRLAGMPR